MKSKIKSILKQKVTHFWLDTRGVYSILFALITLGVVGGVAGLSYDVGARSNASKERLGKCLDAAGTSGGKYLTKSRAEAESHIQMYFNVNCPPNVYMSQIQPQTPGGDYVKISWDGKNYILESGAVVETTVGKLAGFGDVSVGASSKFNLSQLTVELAIAVDNSGSMIEDGRLKNAKRAIGELLDKLYGNSNTVEDVYVSIIPFAQSINIGRKNKHWLKEDAIAKAPYEFGEKEFVHFYPDGTRPEFTANPLYDAKDTYDIQNIIKDTIPHKTGDPDPPTAADTITLPFSVSSSCQLPSVVGVPKYRDKNGNIVDVMCTRNNDQAEDYLHDLLALVENPQQSCNYEGSLDDYWSKTESDLATAVPARWVSGSEGQGYCLMGIEDTIGLSPEECESPNSTRALDGHPIGVFKGSCIIGDYWKGCILERFTTNEMDKSALAALESIRGEWPLAIDKNKLPSPGIEDNSDYSQFYQHSSYIDKFISADPPDSEANKFLVYAWEPHLGVGTRQYSSAISYNDGSTRPNNFLYPLGLGSSSDSKWGDYFDAINTDTTTQSYLLADDMAGRRNYNDYFGGFGLNEIGGGSLNQLLDERHQVMQDQYLGADSDEIDDNNDLDTARGPNVGCTSPAGFLMTDRNEIDFHVESMYANQNEQSLHSIPFAWMRRMFNPAWHDAVTGAPEDIPAQPNAERHKKVAILIFDGLTQVVSRYWGITKANYWYKTMGANSSDANARTELSHLLMAMKMCDEMKKDDPNTEVFIILYEQPTSDTDKYFNEAGRGLSWFEHTEAGSDHGKMTNIINMYKRCAGAVDPETGKSNEISEGHFFYLDQAGKTTLDEAFEQIADRMLEIRISQ